MELLYKINFHININNQGKQIPAMHPFTVPYNTPVQLLSAVSWSSLELTR